MNLILKVLRLDLCIFKGILGKKVGICYCYSTDQTFYTVLPVLLILNIFYPTKRNRVKEAVSFKGQTEDGMEAELISLSA
jgi:hypothetical protein